VQSKNRKAYQKLSKKIKDQENTISKLIGEVTRLMTLYQTVNELTNITENQKNIIHTLTEEVGINLTQKISDWPEFYAQLENKFRGPSQIIKERMQGYIPIVKKILASKKKSVTVDLGCGRGEWLELLKENGLKAIGVDNNKVMVQQCLFQGLSVINEDIMLYLHHQPAEAFNIITAFHIIEHLPFVQLMRLLDELFRTLVKGGAVILETPNPMNVIVGSSSFYCDPTHKRPLPPYLLEYLLSNKGFNRIKILELNPADILAINEEGELSNRFNKLFYGPQDYAIIGYK
jgi:SAM-dependent methyltransferase